MKDWTEFTVELYPKTRTLGEHLGRCEYDEAYILAAQIESDMKKLRGYLDEIEESEGASRMTAPYYPSEICFDCGNKYGTPKGNYAIGVWRGKCGWCGKEGTATSPRDYRYPEYPPKEKK